MSEDASENAQKEKTDSTEVHPYKKLLKETPDSPLTQAVLDEREQEELEKNRTFIEGELDLAGNLWNTYRMGLYTENQWEQPIVTIPNLIVALKQRKLLTQS